MGMVIRPKFNGHRQTSLLGLSLTLVITCKFGWVWARIWQLKWP